MSLALGIDTGGTFTDAVLIRDEAQVVAKAKSLTTRHDLALGIGRAIDAVLQGHEAGEIGLVSLSTTLATNALVEGQGGRVALISIGFDEADLKRAGLTEALRGDPVIAIAGGHGHSGHETAPLDLDALQRGLAAMRDQVGAFAVAGHFAVRNPAHELAVAEAVRAATGRPVTCSHQLSARLNGPKRAMTAVLNARLIAMIGHLVAAAEKLLLERRIAAPLMVVRGDGALVSAAFARERPIETILSGPAASLVGAGWLTQVADAVVSDIGGTTTDVAVLRQGRPRIDPDGASVGGHRTMVEAVAMRTTGLGGDSEVQVIAQGMSSALVLGPRRRVPVALMAQDWPELVHETLDAQLASERSGEMDGQFVLPVLREGRNLSGLTEREGALIAVLGERVMPRGELIRSRVDIGALDRLVGRGLVQIAGFTPSDAAHVLGLHQGWDRAAADKAARLFARQRGNSGEVIAPDAGAMARMVVAQLTRQTAEILLETALAEDGYEHPEKLARHVLSAAGMARHERTARLLTGLALPLVGLGASAGTYYGAVAERLSTQAILHEHADVANAIGAVVGQVRVTVRLVVTVPSEGRFRVHSPEFPADFTDAETALAAAQAAAGRMAEAQARAAGAGELRLEFSRDMRKATVEGRETLIEAEIAATASGRPGIAGGERE